jgi:hypothetical protein
VKLALAAVALVILGYVIPSERVVREMAGVRAGLESHRVAAELEVDGEGIASVVFELDPDRGVRVRDGRGGRWLLVGGRVWAPAGSGVPAWLPPVDVLVLRGEARLFEWLAHADVDLAANELARCGNADCFVIGGRAASDQLWIDKDRFEVRRQRTARGRVVDFESYRDWPGGRFPGRIRVADPLGPIAALRIVRVEPAPELAREDFSLGWLE